MFSQSESDEDNWEYRFFALPDDPLAYSLLGELSDSNIIRYLSLNNLDIPLIKNIISDVQFLHISGYEQQCDVYKCGDIKITIDDTLSILHYKDIFVEYKSDSNANDTITNLLLLFECKLRGKRIKKA